MAIIDIRDNEIRFMCDRATAQKLGAKYIDKSGNMYKVPKTLDAVKDLLRYTDDGALKGLHYKLMKARDRVLAPKTNDDVHFPGFEALRPYQRVDLYFLAQLPHAAVFNEQRTGKTPTILSLMKLKGFKKIVLVVPAGLKLNWEKECDIWLHGIKTTVIRGPKKQRERAYVKLSEQESFVMIISYDTLKQDGELENMINLADIYSFDAVVVDEAHNIRNRKSQRTAAVNCLGKWAKHRYALTGTPSVKAGYDVWPILHFLYPDKFTSYWDFLDRYFEMKKHHFSGTMQPTGKYSRKAALEDLLALIGTNRKRRDIMQWLPNKQYQVIPVELTPKQRKVYDDVLETFEYEEEGETIVDAPSVLAQVTRLRQICLSPKTIGINAPSAKEEFLLEWLQDNPEPVIIFSQFTSYLRELKGTIEKKLKEKVVEINGQVSATDRNNAVHIFQNGKSRILLANIKAAGTGLTLDKAETTIFLDKEWNPADNAQAEDRMVPISKDRAHKMTVISLVAADTYDEQIDVLLNYKHSITSVINSGGLTAINRLYKELKKNAPIHQTAH